LLESGIPVTIARIVRFGGVSATCFGVHNLILVASDLVGLRYGGALLSSFAIVVVVGFVLHSRYTFCTIMTWRGFIRYAAALLANIPIQWVFLWALIDGIHLSMLAAAPISTASMSVINFIASRWAILSEGPAALAQRGGA
jgi:putative flippase GtrA